MEKIGNKELIYTKNFIVSDNENIETTVDIKGWKIKIVMSFNLKAEEQGISVKPVDDYLDITFNNWASSLGTAMTKPAKLGTHSNGSDVYFIAVNHYINGTNMFMFQVVMEVK